MTTAMLRAKKKKGYPVFRCQQYKKVQLNSIWYIKCVYLCCCMTVGGTKYLLLYSLICSHNCFSTAWWVLTALCNLLCKTEVTWHRPRHSDRNDMESDSLTSMKYFWLEQEPVFKQTKKQDKCVCTYGAVDIQHATMAINGH